MVASAPDGGLRARCAAGVAGSQDTLRDALVTEMLDNVCYASRKAASRGETKCKVALMSHHENDKLWAQKGASGQSRKEYTVCEIEKGLAKRGFADSQVRELVVTTPRGLGSVKHYTASVGWGPSSSPSLETAAPLGAPQRRPSSAPAAGRSIMPASVHQMQSAQMRSSLAHVPNTRSNDAAKQLAASDQHRSSNIPGSRYKDSACEAQRCASEAAVNRAVNESSHVLLGRNRSVHPRSRPKRSTSAPTHAAIRAAARAQGKRQQNESSAKVKAPSKLGNQVVQGNPARLASRSRSDPCLSGQGTKQTQAPSLALHGIGTGNSSGRTMKKNRSISKGKGQTGNSGRGAPCPSVA